MPVMVFNYGCGFDIVILHAIFVISEGVEYKYQFDYLKEKNCDIIQGYYFAKPMPKDAFIALLKEKKDGFFRISQ